MMLCCWYYTMLHHITSCMVITGVVDIMNYIHVMFYFEDITLEPYFLILIVTPCYILNLYFTHVLRFVKQHVIMLHIEFILLCYIL